MRSTGAPEVSGTRLRRSRCGSRTRRERAHGTPGPPLAARRAHRAAARTRAGRPGCVRDPPPPARWWARPATGRAPGMRIRGPGRAAGVRRRKERKAWEPERPWLRGVRSPWNLFRIRSATRPFFARMADNPRMESSSRQSSGCPARNASAHSPQSGSRNAFCGQIGEGVISFAVDGSFRPITPAGIRMPPDDRMLDAGSSLSRVDLPAPLRPEIQVSSPGSSRRSRPSITGVRA